MSVAGAERLIIWRHGQTGWNIGERIQGQSDTELNAMGRAQAVAAAHKLAAMRPDAIVTSDLSRATATAAALAEITHLSVRTDPRLRERHFGLWQGLTVDEVALRWPAEFACWRAGEPVPGCEIENLEEVGKRVVAAFLSAAGQVESGTVVLATHGGAARLGIGALLGWTLSVVRTVAVLDNCRWADLRLHPVRGWQLDGYNLG
jgi:probable phosphoglycerate mutase